MRGEFEPNRRQLERAPTLDEVALIPEEIGRARPGSDFDGVADAQRQDDRAVERAVGTLRMNDDLRRRERAVERDDVDAHAEPRLDDEEPKGPARACGRRDRPVSE